MPGRTTKALALIAMSRLAKPTSCVQPKRRRVFLRAVVEQFAAAQLGIRRLNREEEQHMRTRVLRRYVKRSDNSWSGSTLNGYITEGDDRTYQKNFRMNRETFDMWWSSWSKNLAG